MFSASTCYRVLDVLDVLSSLEALEALDHHDALDALEVDDDELASRPPCCDVTTNSLPAGLVAIPTALIPEPHTSVPEM